MKYKVLLSAFAMEDISAIYEYIELHDSLEKAEYVENELEKLINTLSELPNRGHPIKELHKVGLKMNHLREVYFKPYRVIYEIEGNKVHVLAVIDGRRDLDDFLNRRIFRF